MVTAPGDDNTLAIERKLFNHLKKDIPSLEFGEFLVLKKKFEKSFLELLRHGDLLLSKWLLGYKIGHKEYVIKNVKEIDDEIYLELSYKMQNLTPLKFIELKNRFNVLTVKKMEHLDRLREIINTQRRLGCGRHAFKPDEKIKSTSTVQEQLKKRKKRLKTQAVVLDTSKRSPMWRNNKMYIPEKLKIVD